MKKKLSSSEVGYCKPPKYSRFKKGQSGNPNGRPKKRETWATMVQDAFDEKLTVLVNGKRKKISKLGAAFAQYANYAASGDRKILQSLFKVLSNAHEATDAFNLVAAKRELREMNDQDLTQLVVQCLNDPDLAGLLTLGPNGFESPAISKDVADGLPLEQTRNHRKLPK